MQPEISIGPLTLQTFGLMFGLAFIVAGLIAGKRFKELGKPADWAYEGVFAALLGGLIGARIYFLVEHWDEVGDDVFSSIFEGAGLTWFGGAIGGALAVLAWAWWRGVIQMPLADLAAVPLAAGYAIGRIGCQLAGDGDYGKPWDGPWAMAYPDGTVPTEVEVHPTPVYETLFMGAAAIVLWRLRDRFKPGILFALYLFIAGFERFMVEFVRRNEDVALGLTQAQLLSVVMMLVGIVWIAVVQSRGGIRATERAKLV